MWAAAWVVLAAVAAAQVVLTAAVVLMEETKARRPCVKKAPSIKSDGAALSWSPRTVPRCRFSVGQATKVHYTGTATPGFLRKGLAVEFTAEIDEKHVIKEKIAQLKIITLSPGGGGLFAEGSEELNPPDDAFGFNAKGGGDAAPAEKGASKKAAPKKSAKVKLPGT